jgi:hypothetical protein
MDEEWKVVKSKGSTRKKIKQPSPINSKKYHRPLPQQSSIPHDPVIDPDHLGVQRDQYILKLHQIRQQLIQTKFYQICSDCCQQTLCLFPCQFQRVVLLGIGNFTTSSAACLQFALSLELFPLESSYEFFLYDPLLSPLEKLLCQSLGLQIADTLDVHEAIGYTFFYLPHCPYSLYNKILWSNWGQNLERILILGNRSRPAVVLSVSHTLSLTASNLILFAILKIIVHQVTA